MSTKNDRQNPITGSVNWTIITGEAHTVALHSDKNLYGFYLTEYPRAGTITAAPLTVISSGIPAAGQCRPDTANKTGWVWCNSADNGTVVSVNYEGGGMCAHEDNLTSEFGGAGAAGKNYIENNDAEANVEGWTATGAGISVARTTTAAEILRGTAAFKITATGSVVVDTSYIAVTHDTLEIADKGQLGMVQFYYQAGTGYDANDAKVILRDVTNSTDQFVGYIPGGSGQFSGVFTYSDSTSYELLIVSNVSSSAWVLVVDDVFCGTGRSLAAAISPAVGGWTAFTPTGSWVTNTTYTGFWRRVGDSMELQVKVATSGAPTSAALTINMPSGYTIDTSKLAATSGTNVLSRSYGAILDSGTGTFHAFAQYTSTTAVAIHAYSSATASAAVTQAAPMTWAANDTLNIAFAVPIAEWSATASFTHSLTEYVYNTSVTDADDTTSFATGAGGGLVISATSGSARVKRVQFSRPYQHVKIQVQRSGIGPWVDIGSSTISFSSEAGPVYYGIGSGPVSSTQINIVFYAGGPFAGSTWATEYAAGTRWRVVGSDNPLFVESPSLAKTVRITSEKASGTAGVSAVSGAWTNAFTTYNGTDTIYDPNGWGFATIASDQVTLSPGKYIVAYSVSFNVTNGVRLRLYNVTSSAAVSGSYSVNATPHSTDQSNFQVRAQCEITLSSSSAIALEYYSTLTGGIAAPTSSGANEIACDILITKVQ